MKVKKLLIWLRSQVGKPYVWNSKGPNTWDCSGLVWGAFRLVGIDLPHGSYNQVKKGRKIPVEKAHAGCLVFKRSKTTGRVFHVAIVVANGQVCEARGKRFGVVERDFRPSEWSEARKIDALYV